MILLIEEGITSTKSLRNLNYKKAGIFFLSLLFVFSICASIKYIPLKDACAGDGRVECSIPTTTTQPTTQAASYQQKAVDWAVAQTGRGIPYIWANPTRDWGRWNPYTNPPSAFDCSGLIGWAWYWGSDGKVKMYGQTGTDFGSEKDRNGNPYIKFYNRSQLRTGDLIYFYNPVHHVGMYTGTVNGVQWMVHSVTGGPQMSKVDSWSRQITGYLRPTWK